MIIAIAPASNGSHERYNKELKELGVKTFYFDIDSADWLNKLLKKKVDAVFWHADTNGHNYRLILDKVYFIEKILNIPIYPNLNQYFAYNDKIKQTDIFNFLKIPAPKTFVTYNKEEALKFAQKNKYPFVIKHAYSYGGMGVGIIKNEKEAKKNIEEIFSKNKKNKFCIEGYFYAQEFIENDRDLRIITIGQKVRFAYWRINKEDWRNNMGPAGRISLENIPLKVIKKCEEITKTMSYPWMSYDAIIDKKGNIKFLEMSCNFWTTGIEKEGFNVRGALMEYMLKLLKK